MKTYHVIGKRPDVPLHLQVHNAPRPILGSLQEDGEGAILWQGDFVHGRFYAAVNPSDKDVMRRNAEDDACILEYWTIQEARDWLKRWYSENYPKIIVDIDGATDYEITQAFELRANYNRESAK